ncbi:hypothetical protein [Curtobacterium oceanosedimentum]|nr:hypothetical protein [Curtobacterium oceanosedimentum]
MLANLCVAAIDGLQLQWLYEPGAAMTEEFSQFLETYVAPEHNA